MLTVTLIHDAPACEHTGGRVTTTLKSGSILEYCGHVPGGMIRVRDLDGNEFVIHPATTAELSK